METISATEIRLISCFPRQAQKSLLLASLNLHNLLHPAHRYSPAHFSQFDYIRSVIKVFCFTSKKINILLQYGKKKVMETLEGHAHKLSENRYLLAAPTFIQLNCKLPHLPLTCIRRGRSSGIKGRG